MTKELYIKIVKYVLAAAVIGAVLLFVYNTDFSDIAEYLHRLPGAFIWIIAVTFVAYLMGTISWWYCIDTPYKRGVLTRMWIIRHVGEMLAIFNPTNVVAGDSLKSIYLGRMGVRQDKANASVVLSRIILILSALVLIVSSGTYIMIGLVGGLAVVLAAVTILVVGGITYGLFRRFRLIRRLRDRVRRIGFVDRFLQGPGGHQLSQSIDTFRDYLRTARWRLLWAFVFAALHWIFGAVEIFVILKALGHDVTVVDAVFFEMGIQFIKSVFFIIPGQIGVEESGNKLMLNSLGVFNNEVWLILSIMRRARQLLWLGVAVLLYYYLKKMMKPIYQQDVLEIATD